MKTNFLSKRTLGMASILITLIVMVTLLVIPTTDVYANDPYLDSNIPTSGMTDKDIEAMNKHEIAWLISQNQVFRDVYELDTDFHAFIEVEIKKRGEALPLEIAVSKFDDGVAVAQTVHDEAAKVIGAQYGFNAKGRVTNREAALQTVTSARYSLRDAHYRLVVTVRAFRRAAVDWRARFIRH